jgi:hypothetical protein
LRWAAGDALRAYYFQATFSMPTTAVKTVVSYLKKAVRARSKHSNFQLNHSIPVSLAGNGNINLHANWAPEALTEDIALQ